MRRFLVPRASTENASAVQPESERDPPIHVANNSEFNSDEIQSDPALRKQIAEYAPQIQDQVRRAYILKGRTKPVLEFRRTDSRAFSKSWYEKYNWIEYSESEDAAFCFYCFLFKQPGRAEHFGFEVFTKTGFRDWKHAYRALPEHVGGLNSGHNNCVRHYDDFKNQRQSVSTKFALVLKFMLKLFGITNELSQLLQRRDTNIVLALELIHDVKLRLATMRDSGWESIFYEVQQFCNSKGIPVPNMDDEIPVRGRSRLEGRTITNLHYYRAEIFYVIIDKICVEMNHRFSDSNQEVIACFSCLDPKNSFSKFDVQKLSRLAEIYSADFSNSDRTILRDQLETFVLHLRNHAAFSTCKDVESLATKMVETEKHLVFPLVYKLIELALLLSVSTASVERAFSAMKIIKSKLRSTINDDWFNHLMICYTEREIFKSLDDEVITRRFQAMKARKGILPRHH